MDPGEREPCHRDLGDGEQARHEELVVELDLEDVRAGDRVAAPAEADLTDRCAAPVQLLKPRTHATPLLEKCLC